MHGPRKSIRTNFRMGGDMGVVSLRGNIFQRRHGSTPRYHPAILSSNIQEGNEVARVHAMARVVL